MTLNMTNKKWKFIPRITNNIIITNKADIEKLYSDGFVINSDNMCFKCMELKSDKSTSGMCIDCFTKEIAKNDRDER